MRLGICLPVFTRRPDQPVAVARQAEAAGLDGVFCYDHLFPLGNPSGPSLSLLPVLGAVAAATDRVWVGSLVARIGLRTRSELVSGLATLQTIAPGRVVAGLGVGDRLSQDEVSAYGLPFPPVAERVAELVATRQALGRQGVPVWVGGHHPKVLAAAQGADGWNAWGDEAEALVVRRPPNSGLLTWGGDVEVSDRGLAGLALRLEGLAAVGVDWAVVAAPASADWSRLIGYVAGWSQAVK